MNQEEFLQQIETYKSKFHQLLAILQHKTFSSEKAKEYAHQGLLRRIETIHRSVEQVFEIFPVGSENLPSLKTLNDLTISIQASSINIAGAIDNMAWIAIEEKSLLTKKQEKPKPKEVYLFNNKKIDFKFSSVFKANLKDYQKWFEMHKDFRDTLLHRIPLYIAPYSIDPKDNETYQKLKRDKDIAIFFEHDLKKHKEIENRINKLKFFTPTYQHSWSESSAMIYFHPQILVDFKTITKLSYEFFQELFEDDDIIDNFD